MSTTTAVPAARERVAEAIGAGHRRSADLIAATGLPERTVRNALTSGKAAGIFQHDVEQGVWTLASPADEAGETGDGPGWERRLTDLFFEPIGPALAPLLPITGALEVAAEAVDEAAHRQATIVDDIGALAGERRTLEERQRALAQAGAADGEIDAVDDSLARVGVRYDRRCAALPGALRQHGRAQLELLAAIKTALVRAADDAKERLHETAAAWSAARGRVESLSTARESVQRDDQLQAAQAELARFLEQRLPDTAALDVLDEADRFLPTLVQKAQALAELPVAALGAWVQAAERLPEHRANLRAMLRTLADGGVSREAEADLAALKAREAEAIAARQAEEARLGAYRIDPGALQTRIRKLRLELRWIRGLPDHDEEG